jgi:3',5'-cyclic AMP phosphodiesterase CpdA
MLLAQISDVHLNDARPEAAARLAATIDHVLRLPKLPDAVIVTGDIADHGTASEYSAARELLARLPVPVRVMAGNHDDRSGLRAAFGVQGDHAMEQFIQFAWDLGSVRLLALDTTIPRENAGELCAQRLAWLEARLAEAPTQRTLVCLHHPPFATGLRVLDEIGLADVAALERVIARHSQVVRLLAGHVHFTATAHFAGTVAMTAPSTSMTIDHDLSRANEVYMLMGAPPALLLHAWSSDAAGVLSSECVVGERGNSVMIHDGRDWLAPAPPPAQG